MKKANSSGIKKNDGYWNSRLLIGTPATGLVRMEWVMGRYGQTIPTNWSYAEVLQYLSSYVPLGYQVADAENVIAKAFVEGSWEWLLFVESDNVLPPATFIKLNQYMIKGDIPVVGGLYFTKSDPPEPMIYRDLGKGYYADWKLGDKVWCSGLPFGCTLIHGSIIRELWKDAPEYQIGNTITRRVFKHPDGLVGGEKLDYAIVTGTTDLNFCKELKDRGIFKRAGWDKYQEMEHPFLVDTSIFVDHIDNDGIKWPLRSSIAPAFWEGKATLRECL